MSKEIILLEGTPDCAGKRLDIFLSEMVPALTRNAAQILIANGKVSLTDGKSLKKNYRMVGNEQICLEQPDPEPTEIVPQDIPIDIVYEDQDILVINKARGMVVHPAVGNWEGTLVNALMFHCRARLSGINGKIRPGIVHRIDKDTSGLLVVAKNDEAHQFLAEQIANHDVRREYEAIVCGNIKTDEGTIQKPIGRHPVDRKKMAVVETGKPAITHYQVLARYRGYTHMAFQLETGRTHQIRVHMASIGHPIIGDPLYGQKADRYQKLNGQCLHAIRLILTHPRTREQMCFFAPRPAYFEEILKNLPEV